MGSDYEDLVEATGALARITEAADAVAKCPHAETWHDDWSEHCNACGATRSDTPSPPEPWAHAPRVVALLRAVADAP